MSCTPCGHAVLGRLAHTSLAEVPGAVGDVGFAFLCLCVLFLAGGFVFVHGVTADGVGAVSSIDFAFGDLSWVQELWP